MPLAARLLAIPLTIGIVLVGIWVTGALITNDFTVAMFLTAAWMGIAGLAALGVAVLSRDLRWPVLGAYVLTAGVVGLYLAYTTFLDKEVNERVAVAEQPSGGGGGAQEAGEDGNVRVAAGRFEAVRHAAAGEATAIELADGGHVLTLTNFEVDNGPDLRVYLVAGPAATEGEVQDFVDLGALKGNKGNQQYEIPADTDLGRYKTVVIWCRAFSVLFARAPLQA